MTEVRVTPLRPDAQVRFPWDDLPWCTELSAANTTNCERSAAALDSWIPGLSAAIRGDIVGVERCRTDGRQIYGRDDLLRDIHRLDAADSFRVYHDGALIPIDPFLQQTHELHRPGVLNPSKILSETRNGYTYNVGTIDRWNRSLNSLTEHLERTIGGRAEVYAFLSGGDTPASPLHFDQPELLIVPVEGDKFWDVRQSAHRFAMGPDFIDLGEPPVAFADIVHVGDALLVPRGWLHKAAPVGELSLCLTFGLFRQFMARPLISSIERSIEVPDLRMPVAATCGSARDDLESAAGGIADMVDNVVTDDAIARWFARELAYLPTRNDALPSWSLVDGAIDEADLSVRCRVPGGFMAIGTDHRPAFAGGGKLIEASPSVTPILADLLTASGETVEELADEAADSDAIIALCQRLVEEGVLDAEPRTTTPR